MKTFKQFLDEAQKKIDAATAAQIIKRDCAYFLKNSGFNPTDVERTAIFRGSDTISIEPGELKPIPVNKNRRPLTTPIAIHTAADEYMEKQFGVKFRSQSVFVSPDAGIAEEYSRKTFLVFPIGEFKYLWSPTVQDFYYIAQRDGADVLITVANENPDLLTELGLDAKEFDGAQSNAARYHQTVATWNRLKSEKKAEIIKDWLEAGHGEYSSTGLHDAIRHDPASEIMIACDSYYALPYGEFLPLGTAWTQSVLDEMETE